MGLHVAGSGKMSMTDAVHGVSGIECFACQGSWVDHCDVVRLRIGPGPGQSKKKRKGSLSITGGPDRRAGCSSRWQDRGLPIYYITPQRTHRRYADPKKNLGNLLETGQKVVYRIGHFELPIGQ